MAGSETASPGSAVASARELAAIMFSDVVGYTAIMGRDEGAAMRALDTHRGTLRSILPKHNGHLIGEIGDGTLSSFHSAIDAVNCAREVQAISGDDPELRLRIGIHLGDVVFTNNTVLGDGVNVASRIHALAPPGGVCISEHVFDEIRNKPGIVAKDLGRKRLKNVSRPIRVYALFAEDEPARAIGTHPIIAGAIAAVAIVVAIAFANRGQIVTALRSRVPIAEPTKATVGVLPFANLSGSKDDEYFSDGMTDEIIGDLSKIAGLQVAGRTSSFALKGQNIDVHKAAGMLGVRNLLEGSVRRAANRVRIEVQLTDAKSGFNLWSERYDEDLSDVFGIQSDVAERVADKLRVKLLANEQTRVEKKPTQNVDAYNLYLRGKFYSYSDVFKAREYFNRAIEKDPDFAPAYVAVADGYGFLADIEMPSHESIEKVERLDRRALAIDPDLAAAHESIANYVLCQYEWNWKASEQEFKVALKLDPNNADAYCWYGWLFAWTRRYDDAIAQLQQAHQLDPLSPFYVAVLGDLHRDSGQFDRALEYHRQVLDMAPDFSFSYLGIGNDLFEKGDVSGAWPYLQKWTGIVNDPVSRSFMATFYARGGRGDDAKKILEELKERSRHEFVSNFAFFNAYAASGDMDRAYQYLEKAYQDHSVFIPFLSLRGYREFLGADPRFQAMYKKVGFPR